MAFTPDAFNTGVSENDTNAQSTITITPGTLTNGVLIVAAGWSTTSTTILNANFAGNTLRVAISQATNRGAALLHMYNPPAGLGTVTINWSANAGRANLMVGTWDGADTTFFPSGVYVASANGSNGAPSVTPTTENNALVVDCVSLSFTAGDTLTAGANQTERGKISGGATISGLSSQNGSDGGAMTWTDSNNTRVWGAVAASFRAFVAPAGGIKSPIFGREVSPNFGGLVVR